MMSNGLSTLAQANADEPGAVFLIVQLAIIVLVIAGMWKMFTKAGQPGWAAIIPIVNIYFLCKIGGKPWWWMILLLIPIVNIVISIMITAAVGKAFGKGVLFIIGMVFLPFIFFPVLGFGSSQYQGPQIDRRSRTGCRRDCRGRRDRTCRESE